MLNTSLSSFKEFAISSSVSKSAGALPLRALMAAVTSAVISVAVGRSLNLEETELSSAFNAKSCVKRCAAAVLVRSRT